jgi:hypothetical protein
MEEQKCHFYERNQKTDQRIKHRTREEAKEQITAPEKKQKNKSPHQRRIKEKQKIKTQKLPEKLDP